MPRALLTLQYLGTRYAGWQFQTNALSVQQVVEEALAALCQQPVSLEAAGRTDSGVHSRGQRAHADIPIDIDARGLTLGMNNLLPPDIRIREVHWVEAAFHARFAPSLKTYVYQIWNGREADVFLAATHAHVIKRLDESLMAQAAACLAGYHDFRSFTVRDPEVRSTWRTVHRVSVEREGDVVRFSITADGFLRFMVRRMAGSLIELGRGRAHPEVVVRALEPGFDVSRWTAPAHGLTLQEIEYRDGTATCESVRSI